MHRFYHARSVYTHRSISDMRADKCVILYIRHQTQNSVRKLHISCEQRHAWCSICVCVALMCMCGVCVIGHAPACGYGRPVAFAASVAVELAAILRAAAAAAASARLAL